MNGQHYNDNNNALQKIKEKDNNYISNTKLINNDKISKNDIKLDNNQKMDKLNLNSINEEYDIYISNLKEQLSIVKEERKKTENEFNIIKHRLTLLKNQEKTNNINFQNIKYRFKKIINNRKKSQGKLKKNINKKIYFKNYFSDSQNVEKFKKSNNSLKFSHTPKNLVNFNRTFSHFKTKNNNIKYNKKSIDCSDIENSKKKLRQKLIEQLKEDEEERKKIEDEIAKIEQEEMLLLKTFKIDKFEG